MLSQNLNLLRTQRPPLAQAVERFLFEHEIRIEPQPDGSRRCCCISSINGEKEEWTAASSTHPNLNLESAIRNYLPKQEWLLCLGIEALQPSFFPSEKLSKNNSILIVEPDSKRFIVHASLYSLESYIQNRQVYFFIGGGAFEQSCQAIENELEPYFLSGGALRWILSPPYDAPSDDAMSYIEEWQRRFQARATDIHRCSQKFLQHYQQPNPPPTKTVLIVEPAVNCWLVLGRGLALGFKELSYQVVERAVPHPPSSISLYDSLQLRLDLIRHRPDFIVTISHPSDLFLRSCENVSVKRLVWYVDHPDHLPQYKHGSYDYLFYSWKEFAEPLAERSARLLGEIPVGGYPLPCVHRNEFACEIGFVGSVMNTAPLRRKIPAEILQRLDELLECKQQETASPIAALWMRFDFAEKEQSAIADAIGPALRQRGMSDKQLVLSFLHIESIRLRRVRLLLQLKDFDLKIYGNPDWTMLLKGTPIAASFQNKGLTAQECCDFYRSAKISLNIHPPFSHSGPTSRDVDIPMCDGFLLSDIHLYAKERMLEFFEPETEIALYEGERDLPEKAAYYVSRPEEREAIVRRAQQRIAASFRYKDRVKRMLVLIKSD